MQNKTQPSPQQTAKILWGALLFSHLMYVFVLYTINQRFEGVKGLENPTMLPVMGSLALVAYAAGFFLFNYFLNAEKKKKQHSTLEEMATTYFVPMIIRLALFEAAGICGFVLAFLSHDNNYYYPLLLINIGLFLMNFPSEQRIKDAFKA